MPGINAEILKWARETAGLSLVDAAEKLGIKLARGIAGEDRLAAIEAGEPQATRPQLIKMSKLYRRPLLTFYLSAPPQLGERGQDFRTLPPEHSRTKKALVDALIRDIRTRQEIARALIEDEDDVTPLSFVGSMTLRNGPDAVLASIRDTLKLNLNQYRQNDSSDRSAPIGFTYLRRQAERAGIYVLLIGNLGSYQTSLDVETFRGFALSDNLAPFVVINDQDSDRAWAFTLLHELCHIWLGQTGVSGARASTSVEQFCNDVASRFLLPAEESNELRNFRNLSFDVLAARIRVLAEQKNISLSMIAYSLLREDIIDQARWNQLSALFRQQWITARQNRKDENRDREGGPNYYVVRRHRIGEGLISLARRSISDGTLTPSKAGKLLGVKPTNVYNLVDPHTGVASGRAA
jgi:Zn-dependent peptidase ImmA (M78 family)/transcriptional regulator with XRE-family HTH domain